MKLFSPSQVEKINSIAAQSNEVAANTKAVSTKSMSQDLEAISKQVIEYFKDSDAILVRTASQLHDYITGCIEAGEAGYDTETTGLDRLHDNVIGFSLYYPGAKGECYVPLRHMVPIFEVPYDNQVSIEDAKRELLRLVAAKVRLILANADFDIAMTFRTLGVDIIPIVYYDVILAWRCIKENEPDNALKVLYAKYPMHGKVDPKKFSDFFKPELFKYVRPEVAGLYAGNDAKITYDLYKWQLPLVTKTHARCQKHHLEKIADIVWNLEIPLIKICATLHREGIYLDSSIIPALHDRYESNLNSEKLGLAQSVQSLIDDKDIAVNRKRPFRTGSDFNPNSPIHVKYLVNNLLGLDATSTGKDVLSEIDHDSAKHVLGVRGGIKLLGTYIDKMPKISGKDGRIHCSFKAIGAATGRFSSESPNLQNIPSKKHDIRHMFRATPSYTESVGTYENVLSVNNVDEVEVLDKGWVKACEVCQGDVLLDEKGIRHIVENVELIERTVKLAVSLE